MRSLLPFWRWLRAEIVIGFLIATVFWAGVLGWQTANAPTDAEKQKCYEAAEKAHHKTEECKTLWERTTSDPVAFFTFWLVVSTIGRGVSTVMLWRAGEKQFRHARRSAAIQARDMRDSIDAANRSAAASERALNELERPWLFVFDVSRPMNEAQDDFFIEYTVVNYGKMPAIIEYPRIGFVFSDTSGFPQQPLYPNEDHSLVAAPIMRPGEERRIREYFPENHERPVAFHIINEGTTDQKLVAIPSVDLPNGLMLFFRVVISYRGPCSKGHETGANWLYREPWNFVVRGDEYNYTR